MSSALGRQVLWLLAIALGVYCLPIVWRSRSRLGIEDGHIVASRLKGLAAFLVGVSILILIMEPVHATFATYDRLLIDWRTRLPVIAGLAAASGFLSGLSPGTPIRSAVAVSWPATTYTVLAWAAYLTIASLVPDTDSSQQQELIRYATPLLTLVTAFPAVAFVAGLVGAYGGMAVRRHLPVLPNIGPALRQPTWVGVQGILLMLGIVMLLFGTVALLVPRAHFVNATPTPGSTIAALPSSVTINFDSPLHESSSMWVFSERVGRVARVSGGSTVEATDDWSTLMAPVRQESDRELYKVEWRARTRRGYFTPWGAEGSFYFGVRVPVPEHLTPREWDEGSLSPRSGGDARFYALFSGAFCVTLALLWPRIKAVNGRRE